MIRPALEANCFMKARKWRSAMAYFERMRDVISGPVQFRSDPARGRAGLADVSIEMAAGIA